MRLVAAACYGGSVVQRGGADESRPHAKEATDMLRNVADKVMWVGRAAVFVVGLAVILALVLGAATAAFGANGDFFKVGKSNFASAVSVLDKSGPGPALRLLVDSGPPLAVTSSTKVANLNADKVDSFNASQLVRGASASDFVNTTTSPHPANLFTVSAPREGGLLVNLAFSCN